jgi:hypothetical protein
LRRSLELTRSSQRFEVAFGKTQYAPPSFPDRAHCLQHRLPNRQRLQVGAESHKTLVAPRERWDHHQLIAPCVEYTLDDGDFGDLTDPDENCSVNYISGRDKIKTNRFDWLKNNQRNCEQRQSGIWTQGANPPSNPPEDRQLGNPSPERSDDREEDCVDEEIQRREGNQNRLECLRNTSSSLSSLATRFLAIWHLLFVRGRPRVPSAIHFGTHDFRYVGCLSRCLCSPYTSHVGRSLRNGRYRWRVRCCALQRGRRVLGVLGLLSVCDPGHENQRGPSQQQ